MAAFVEGFADAVGIHPLSHRDTEIVRDLEAVQNL